mmetsp:Transcript_13538/g.33246  ORF Transcript_13538/g.33246 Transcript_13538/m.33246 type:complete len:478 (-) Transcript_13538:1093-2526(-)
MEFFTTRTRTTFLPASYDHVDGHGLFEHLLGRAVAAGAGGRLVLQCAYCENVFRDVAGHAVLYAPNGMEAGLDAVELRQGVLNQIARHLVERQDLLLLCCSTCRFSRPLRCSAVVGYHQSIADLLAQLQLASSRRSWVLRPSRRSLLLDVRAINFRTARADAVSVVTHHDTSHALLVFFREHEVCFRRHTFTRGNRRVEGHRSSHGRTHLKILVDKVSDVRHLIGRDQAVAVAVNHVEKLHDLLLRQPGDAGRVERQDEQIQVHFLGDLRDGVLHAFRFAAAGSTSAAGCVRRLRILPSCRAGGWLALGFSPTTVVFIFCRARRSTSADGVAAVARQVPLDFVRRLDQIELKPRRPIRKLDFSTAVLVYVLEDPAHLLPRHPRDAAFEQPRGEFRERQGVALLPLQLGLEEGAGVADVVPIHVFDQPGKFVVEEQLVGNAKLPLLGIDVAGVVPVKLLEQVAELLLLEPKNAGLLQY